MSEENKKKRQSSVENCRFFLVEATGYFINEAGFISSFGSCKKRQSDQLQRA